MLIVIVIESLPNNRIQTRSILNVLAENKINVNYKLKFFGVRVENIVGKGENAGNQHFLLHSQGFQKGSYPGSLTVMVACEKVKDFLHFFPESKSLMIILLVFFLLILPLIALATFLSYYFRHTILARWHHKFNNTKHK